MEKELEATTSKMAKLTIKTKQEVRKKEKIPCTKCGKLIRRDGMAAHRNNKKCRLAQAGKKYDHKKHNGEKVKCEICGKLRSRATMKRHQRSKLCRPIVES